MRRVGRWVAVLAVIGVLAVLAVILYLILEPLHRDDDDGALAAVQIVASAPVWAVQSLQAQGTNAPRANPLSPSAYRIRPATIRMDPTAATTGAVNPTRPEREKARIAT